MNHPYVSVIVPVYNTSDYLDRCLQSIHLQSLKEIEIVVVNDGSTDDSEKKLVEWQKKDSRIVLYNRENGGLSAARNTGIEKAKGKYLAFVDSDDWVEVSFLKNMWDLAEQFSADMVVCNLKKVDDYGRILQRISQLQNKPTGFILKENFDVFGDLSWFACNKLFHSKLFKNLRFTENIHFEDIATIPRVMLQCENLAHAHFYLYNYLERQGSITRSFTQKGLDMFMAIETVKKSFLSSPYEKEKKQWKRFVILQGFYSYLAYVARVKEAALQSEMYEKLRKLMEEESISKTEILRYKRAGKNYFLSLNIPKQLYYLYVLLFKI